MSDQKVYMLNAVWFKANGGESRYREYLKAISPMMRKVGGRKLKSFVPERAIIGDFDADLVFFVEYPSWSAFKEFANSAEYHSVAFMREEAISNSLLVRCSRPDAATGSETSFSESVSAN